MLLNHTRSGPFTPSSYSTANTRPTIGEQDRVRGGGGGGDVSRVAIVGLKAHLRAEADV